jgi:hypothetical protein
MRVLACLCVLLAFGADLRAEMVIRGSWHAVLHIERNRKIQVRQFGSVMLSGRLVEADADRLVIRHQRADRSIARKDIEIVKLRTALSRVRNAGIGAGIGTGIGFVVGLAATRERHDDWQTVRAFSTVMGALIGFGLGWIPAGHKTVYKASR